jgi:hypothetical protein
MRIQLSKYLVAKNDAKIQKAESPGIDSFIILVLSIILIPGLFLLLLGSSNMSKGFFYGFIGLYSIFLFANLCAASTCYLFHIRAEKQKATTWGTLIKGNQLTIIPGSFHRRGAYLIGNYRGHHLRLDTPRQEHVSTRLILSTNYSTNTPFAAEAQRRDTNQIAAEVIHLLNSTNQLSNLKGQLKTGTKGYILVYEQNGSEKDVNYLQHLFDLLSDLGDIYPKVIKIGGKIIPPLQAVAINHNHFLQQVAIRWLQDIEQETTQRLSLRAAHLICPFCLLKCTAHEVRLRTGQSIKYYGCRGCGQSQEFFSGLVIAVLDNTNSEQFQQQNILQVNWLIGRNLFDFDKIEIRQATDEEVERFAVQVGNDTDPIRQPRYKHMHCRVSSEYHLAENTMRILQQIFGQVEVRKLEEQVGN